MESIEPVVQVKCDSCAAVKRQKGCPDIGSWYVKLPCTCEQHATAPQVGSSLDIGFCSVANYSSPTTEALQPRRLFDDEFAADDGVALCFDEPGRDEDDSKNIDSLSEPEVAGIEEEGTRGVAQGACGHVGTSSLSIP